MNKFTHVILQHANEKLSSLKEQWKTDLLNIDDDDKINTELSVIDRFILSQQFNNDELLEETFTIFTSVSATHICCISIF